MMFSVRSLTFPVILVSLIAVGCQAPSTTPPAGFTSLSQTAPVTDAASSGGVSWIDYDGDGDTDLYVTNGYDVSAGTAVPQANRLYRNDGAGILTPLTQGPLVEVDGFSSGSTWGDYDNDGDLDAFVTNQQDQDNFLFRNEGGGTFLQILEGPHVTDGGHSYSASWVDVDNDGHLDLFVGNGGLSHSSPNFLYRNQGNGTFERITDGPVVSDTAASAGGVWGDYDGDNDLDLFVATAGGPNAFYRNDGDWNFTSIVDSPILDNMFPASSAAWGDYDNDGDLDLAIGTMYGATTRLYDNTGAGTFSEVADAGDLTLDAGYSYGVNWADYDNDGHLDIVVANWGAASVLYRNDGTGRFERLPRSAFSSKVSFAATVAWADYDDDGDMDVYLGNWPNEPGAGEPNDLFRNDLNDSNWLKLTLQGTTSNRSAIGSTIRIATTAGGELTIQRRDVSPHTSWRSQNDLDVHFGLGDATSVDWLEITWPTGTSRKFEAVDANQRIVITENGDQLQFRP